MSDTIKGAVLMMLSMAGFVINDAFMRHALETLPLVQAVFLRGIVITMVLGVLAWSRGALSYHAAPEDRRRIRIRSGCELLATYMFLTALSLMPFANLSAIMQVLPLSVTLGAALFLGTPIGWRRMMAILIGFIGVLIVVRPGMAGFNIGSLLALGAVLIVTVRDLAAKTLNRDTPSVLVALHATVLLTGVNGVILLTRDWAPVAPVTWGYLIGAAAVLCVGYVASVSAMRIGDLATIAPFRYSSLIWAMLLGVLIFEETLEFWTLIGAGVIVAMGIFSFYRERRLISGSHR